MRKALIIGYGSIGQRHARLLVEMGCRVGVVSSRAIDITQHYFELRQALIDWDPEYVVVANRTSEHHQIVESLAELDYVGRVLIEKPLFSYPSEFPRHNFSSVAVAYNLRCHPLLAKLKALLDSATRVVTASIHVGSYLPDWRPDTDYRHGYSAKREQGGGVLRDLSHELDYASWLLGPWRRLTALGGHLSHLEIDSDDAYTLLMETERCPLVSIHLNYLDRSPRREILVNTDQHTILIDLVKNTMAIGGVQETISVAPDDTYRAEHRAMLAGNTEGLCSLEEAMETLLTIDAAERAATSCIWLERQH